MITVFIAQFLKILIPSIHAKKLILSNFLETGGMPSSHSALVSTLALSILLYEGITTSFIVSLVLAAIVIRDSYGMRKSVGEHSMTLNQIIDLLNKTKNKSQILKIVKVIKGHSIAQVTAGIILGILIPLITYLIIN